MTRTVIVQVELAAIVAPDKVIPLAPAPGGAPPLQPLATVGVLLTTRFVGKVSVNPTPVRAITFGLLIARLSVAVPLVKMLAGLKDLVMVGALTTCRIAVLLVLYVPVAVDNVPVVFG